jgi:hypothetical protein
MTVDVTCSAALHKLARPQLRVVRHILHLHRRGVVETVVARASMVDVFEYNERTRFRLRYVDSIDAKE